MPLIKRGQKGSRLTRAELDGNFDFLEAAIANQASSVHSAGTSLALDSLLGRVYAPLTVSGPTTITVTGSTLGAWASMSVIADGVNVPVLAGCVLDGSDFGYLNTAGVRNALRVEYDGISRLAAWRQDANPVSVVAPAPAEDAITTAYRAALATAGVTPNETHMGYVNTFASGLRSANLHGKITAINLACQDTLAGSLVSLIGANAAAVGSPTFDPALGWSNATSTSYINTGVTPSTVALGFGAYLRTAQPSDTTARCLIGTSSATDVFRVCGNRSAAGASSSGAVSALTGGTANGAATTGGLVAGAYHAIRRGATDEVLLKNGASVGTNTTSTTPGAGTVPLYLYVQNATAGPTTTSVLATGSRVAAYWVDDGTMTNTEASTLYTLLQAFQTSMGRNV